MKSTSTVIHNMQWLWPYWRPYRLWLVKIVLMSLFHAAVSVAIPFLYISIIDGIHLLGKAEGESELNKWIALLFLLGVASFISSFLVTIYRARMNMKLEWDIRQKIFTTILAMGPSFFHRFRTGDLVTRLTDDLGRKLSWFACSGIFRSFESLLRIVFSLSIMYAINPMLMVLSLIPLPIQFFTFVRTESLLHKRYAALQTLISRVTNLIESCFSGIRVVQAYTMEKKQWQRFHEETEKRATAEVAAESATIIVQSLYGYFWQFAVVIVLLVGGWMVIDNTLTIGEFVAFDYYIGLLVFPMFDIGNLLVSYRRAAVSISRLREIEHAASEMSNARQGHVTPASLLPAIRFENVSCTVQGKTLLEDISFDVAAGQCVAFVGPVGSGKSSLFSLINGQLKPDRGRILISDTLLEELADTALTELIGFVPQEPVLFSQTLYDNVVFGRDGLSEDAIAASLKISRLEQDISSFPDKMKTYIGQRGMQLSGGQKQRTALARALAGTPRILLLDDVTASLDADTEELLWQALLTIQPRPTICVVTNRPATLEKADTIFVLSEGRIIERGNHQSLMRLQGLYYRIYSRSRWELSLLKSG